MQLKKTKILNLACDACCCRCFLASDHRYCKPQRGRKIELGEICSTERWEVRAARCGRRRGETCSTRPFKANAFESMMKQRGANPKLAREIDAKERKNKNFRLALNSLSFDSWGITFSYLLIYFFIGPKNKPHAHFVKKEKNRLILYGNVADISL